MEKYKIEKDSVQEIPIRFLVASVSRWQSWPTDPMCLRSIRIDFTENHYGKIGGEYAD